MASIRGARSAEGRYVQLRNAALQDGRLSFRARGILACVLSHPEDWHVTSDSLAEYGTEGRDAIRKALNELDKHGYLRRTRARSEAGTWAWSWVLTDDPFAENPSTENQSLVPPATMQETAGGTSDWKTVDGKPGHLYKTVPKDVNKIPPSPVVDPAEVAAPAEASGRAPEHAPPAAPGREGGRISNQPPTPRPAEAFLMALPAPWTLSAADAARLGPRLAAAAVRGGWAPGPALADALTGNPGGIINHRAVLASRIENLPDYIPPVPTVPAGPRSCTECHTMHRVTTDGGLCMDCVRGRGIDPTTPAVTDRLRDVRSAIRRTDTP